jgi:simple sugar transport system permease protein
VHDSATFPSIFSVHTGVLLAFLAALGVWWLLERSTIGFEMRAVGANPSAAGTAGMHVPRVYFLAMTLAGALAGLAAAMQILGQHNSLTENVAGTIGFDAITVALLGRATPLGTVLAGLLFGALSAGGLSMQAAAGVPPELAQVLQALIVLFVAAPALVRKVLHVRAEGDGGTVMAKGWGG